MNIINPFSLIFFIILIILMAIRAIKRGDTELEDEAVVIDHLKHPHEIQDVENFIQGPFGSIAIKKDLKDLTKDKESDRIAS